VRWSRTLRTDPTLARGQVSAIAGEIVIDLAPALAEARRRSGFAGDPFLTVELTQYSRSIDVQLRVSGERVIPIAVER
jgi:hypothetical protein